MKFQTDIILTSAPHSGVGITYICPQVSLTLRSLREEFEHYVGSCQMINLWSHHHSPSTVLVDVIISFQYDIQRASR
jgi:hypothetical protein